MSRLDEVLAIARQVPVFPCRRTPAEFIVNGKPKVYKAKSPLTAHGFEAATQDAETIRDWFAEHPDCLWGVPTGSRTGIIAVDYDTEKADELAREWLTANADALMATRTHSTLSGGRHYLFHSQNRYSSGVCVTLAGLKRTGIDIRAEGGYIIWWPLEGLAVTGEMQPLPDALLSGRSIEARELKPLPAATPESWQRESAKAADVLAFHDPENYDEWIGAGMSLHAASGGSDSGFKLWSAWSSGELTGESPRNYSGLDDLRYRWESFSSDKPREKLRGIGSLVQVAKARGYVNGSANVSRETFEPPPFSDDDIPPVHEDGYIESLIASSPFSVSTVSGPRIEAGEDRKETQSPVIPPRHLIPWASMEGAQPPPREWILENWIPAKRDTLLAGRGGIGKTLLAQCLCTALAMGGDYVDEINSPKRCLLWAGEDDTDELWRRQNNINAHYNITMGQIADRFHAIDYSNADITLAAAMHGSLYPTALMAELREQVNDWKIDAVFLDNVARIYGGNENDRHQVTQFMSWLRAAIEPAGLILLSHPAKIAGSEYSGSTAWEGAVRARLFLSDKHPDAKPVAGEEEEQVDDSVRYLSKRKANYSANDIRRLQLLGGVLVPDSIPDRGQPRGVSSDMVKDTILRAIRTLSARDIYGNESTASPAYLPKLMREYKLLDRASSGQVAAVIREMILAGELVRGQVGQNSNRTPRMGIKLP